MTVHRFFSDQPTGGVPFYRDLVTGGRTRFATVRRPLHPAHHPAVLFGLPVTATAVSDCDAFYGHRDVVVVRLGFAT